MKVGEALKIIRDCDWDCKEASRIIVDDLLSKGIYSVAFELDRTNALERLERFLAKLVQKELDGKFTAAPQIYNDIPPSYGTDPSIINEAFMLLWLLLHVKCMGKFAAKVEWFLRPWSH